MHTLKRLIAMIALIGGLTAMLGACDNTIRGVGKDIREAGDAIEDSTS
ncbi:MAG: entericidin A/B family lipoprotein [Pseudomonadota bacterium]